MNNEFLNNEEIAQRIKSRRKELNLTLKDVSKKVGVAVSTIQRYENAKIDEIKLPVVESIGRALNVNPSWLVIRNEPKELLHGIGFEPTTEPFYTKVLDMKAKGRIPQDAKADTLGIPQDEQEILIFYRALEHDDKFKAAKIFEYINKMNEAGIYEVEKHAKYIASQDEYKKPCESEVLLTKEDA